MDKKVILWIVIGILAIAVVYIAFFKSSTTGKVVQLSNGQLDTTGWTDNEKMNYEMHGTVPARLQQSSTPSASSGMVGGC